MIRQGLLTSAGNTRARQYQLPIINQFAVDMAVTPNLEEDLIWRKHIEPIFADLPPNVQLIGQHGFTEMLNNVIDHSGSVIVHLLALRTAANVSMMVSDEGIGIFKKIYMERSLEDPRHAILELSKGRLTTDPDRHTGEGIFFTSRIFDRFAILSGNLSLTCTPEQGDWLFDLADWGVKVDELPSGMPGTQVLMEISAFSERSLKQVTDEFAGEDQDYSFSKTQVPVRLARYGAEQLVSRSQAKRLLTRVTIFKEVILDFEGVETIGQAFADEIFRVFKKDHPGTHLTVSRANSQVAAMIKHVQHSSESHFPAV